MEEPERWLRTRRPNLIVWNEDGSVNIDESLAAVFEEDYVAFADGPKKFPLTVDTWLFEE